MRDALKRVSLEVEAKLAYVPVDGFVSGLDDQVPYMPIHIYIYIHTYTSLPIPQPDRRTSRRT